jgi:hypothetical protein
MESIGQILSEYVCAHEQTEVRKKLNAGGQWMLRKQCVACGRAASSNLAHSTVPAIDACPHWDEVLERRGEAQARQRFEELRVAADQAWREAYERYLLSPEWRERRAAGMRRARGMCEGCGKARAVQVHHLTYTRVGREMLFDLVAVCDPCHDEIHFGTSPAAFQRGPAWCAR